MLLVFISIAIVIISNDYPGNTVYSAHIYALNLGLVFCHN